MKYWSVNKRGEFGFDIESIILQELKSEEMTKRQEFKTNIEKSTLELLDDKTISSILEALHKKCEIPEL